MSQANRTASNVGSFVHLASHYESTDDVLNDARLSIDEKRVILSSWASDIHVVESHPELRGIPGIPYKLRLDDILEALRQLDSDNDPPPRGGLGMRPPCFSNDYTSSNTRQCYTDGYIRRRRYRSKQWSLTPNRSRWTREANVRRYHKLLSTHLTDIERNFIERRLAEEFQTE